jgi:chromosome partitioning protein
LRWNFTIYVLISVIKIGYNMKPIVITLVCNKGGVGRSTTACNVGWKLAEMGYKTLIIDLDSQSNTSITLAKNYEQQVIEAEKSLTNMLSKNDAYMAEYTINTNHPNLDIIASSYELDTTELIVRNEPSPNTILRDRFDDYIKEEYDVIIFDTPPKKTDKMLHNGLAVSTHYWYVISSEAKWALDAVGMMNKTISDVCGSVNNNIKPIPTLLTMFRRRNALSLLVKQQCEKIFDYGVMETSIRDTTEIRKASATKKTIFEFNRRSEVAKDYKNATQELIDYIGIDQTELKL